MHPDGKQGIILSAGTKIGEGQTENGTVTITKFQEELIQVQPEVIQQLLNRGLPLGIYEIKEIEAPKGYYYEKNDTKTIKIESKNDHEEIEKVTMSIKNQRQITELGMQTPGITIEKEAEQKAYKEGEQIRYTIKITNIGNTVLKDVEVKESMEGGQFEETGNNTVLLEKLEKGEIKTLTYCYQIPEGMQGELNNQVTVIATPVRTVTTEDGEEKEELIEKITDEAEEKVWIETKLQKTANKKIVQPGSIVEYQLIVSNPDDEAIEEATIQDEKIKQDMIWKASREDIRVQEDGIIMIGRIEPREVIKIIYQYQIPEDYTQESLINEATLTGKRNEEAIPPEKTSTTVEVKKSGIQIEKQTDQDTYQKGEEISYNIKVTNIGYTTLKDITVKEELGNGKFEAKTGIQVMDDQTVKIEELRVGESIYLTYNYTVENEKTIGEKVQNKVTAKGKGMLEEGKEDEEVTDEAEREIVVKEKDPTNRQVGVYKTDEETQEKITGAIFGLYNAEEIAGILKKDTLIGTATTNEAGYAQFTQDLPIGKYYIQEIQPIAGYIHNTRKLEIDSTTIGAGEKEYLVKMEINNKKTEINIEKIEKQEKREEEEEERPEENEQEENAEEKP